MTSIWEQLNSLDDSISYDYFDGDRQSLLEMANVRGNDVVIDDIDFSFYFSGHNANHGIRIKVFWDPTRMSPNDDGYIELHGDYRYVSSPQAQHKPKGWQIRGLQYFCKKYKVLFSAVWEQKLPEDTVQKYFKGELGFHEVLTRFQGISEKEFFVINHCRTPRELEACVRENKIFNMND